jgi:hypothetical protein
MSLDVYLTMPGATQAKGTGVFVREGGANIELTESQVRERFPNYEPVAVVQEDGEEVYWRNITHNLGKMASEAGVYQAMWRPEEQGWTKASELVEPLKSGLEQLRSDPDRFKAFNPENGWGSYEGLVEFVESYLSACIEYPEADVSVSR